MNAPCQVISKLDVAMFMG